MGEDWMPGPWKAGDDSVVAPDGGVIADCLIFASEDINRANAHLIAAAPDLYAALSEARERMQGASPAMKALRERTDAALARARGEGGDA